MLARVGDLSEAVVAPLLALPLEQLTLIGVFQRDERAALEAVAATCERLLGADARGPKEVVFVEAPSGSRERARRALRRPVG